MTSAKSHKSTREVRQLGDSLLTLGDVQTSWQATRMETQIPAWGNLACGGSVSLIVTLQRPHIWAYVF